MLSADNRVFRTIRSLVVSLAVPACVLANLAQRVSAETVSIAVIDYQDTWSNTKGLGQILADLGYSYTDLTAGLLTGGAIDLAGYNTFIIGSHVVQNTTLGAAIEAAEPTMNAFVGSGGVVIMLTQADQNRANEDWLQPPAYVIRGDADFDPVVQIQSGHQIFQQPNLITNANLSGWQYVGSSTWPTSWESFVTFQNVGVLAGNAAVDPTMAAILESGWGHGRAVFTSLAPDKARNIGNAQAKAQAPRLMRNLMQYAQDVLDGRAADVVINSPAGPYAGIIHGAVFSDTNHNGARDAGEPGIANVGVSDTVDLVVTGADGSYSLPNAANNATLVYVCIPAQYAKTANWYHHVNAGSALADFDFALSPDDESGPFEFVQVTDIHIGGSGNRLLYTDAIAQICGLTNPPELIIATGDLTNTGAVSEYTDYAAATATSSVPVFNVFGNHDANGGTTLNYRAYLGPDYYSFNYGDCHFLVINSVHSTAQQMAWINADLSLLRGNRKLFIFQHYSPSEAQHTQYVGCHADAVFTGHWHSQHSVAIGPMRSYNSPNLLFGGIDCSPASFKVVSVDGSSVITRTRYMTDGKRLQIVSPNQSQLISNTDIPIVVNAYETSADVTSATYAIAGGAGQVAAGSLTPEGDWSWVGVFSAKSPLRGTYSITVTATNDKAETHSASATFAVLNRRLPQPRPAGNWPQFGGGAGRGGLAGDSTLTPPLGIAWTAHSGGNIDFSSPVLYQDTLLVGAKDRGDFAHNGVLALNTADGSTKWFARTPAAVSHSVATDGSQVYACSHGGLSHWFDQDTGQEIRTQPLGSAYQRFLYGAPVVYGDRVYAGTFGCFAAFDRAAGTEQGHQTYGVDWISSNASPATDGNLLVVAANWATTYNLIGVTPADGHVLWQYACAGLHGSPVIAGDRVVFTSYDGKIAAVSTATGTQTWSVNLSGPSATTPAVSGNTVVAGGTGSVQAFRFDNGQLLWTFPIGTSPLKMSPYNNTFASLAGSPTIVGSTVYVPCGDGRLYALSLASGSLLWSMNLGTPILSAPCISGNAMFLTAFDGHVYALVDGTPLGPPGDFDGDNDVDQSDFGFLQACYSGSGVAYAPGCADVDLDRDVDQNDLAIFLRCMSGRDVPVDPSCAI
jgi:outer membrane protein assembly factor BamB